MKLIQFAEKLLVFALWAVLFICCANVTIARPDAGFGVFAAGFAGGCFLLIVSLVVLGNHEQLD